MKQVDVAIIGAGIMGLAHAYHAARAGLSVAVVERGPQAKGASLRNFGMLAIVAQAPGAQLERARRALACWREVAAGAGVGIEQTGCLFVARAPEEMAVLEQAAAAASDSGHALELATQTRLADYAGALRPGMLGGLWSPDAWKVDQRQAAAKIAAWLAREHGVAFYFSTEAMAIAPPVLETSRGPLRATQALLCAGDDFETLCPEVFRAAGVIRCQLQMLRTAPQPGGWRLSPFLLGGLSMTRYNLFKDCPGLPDLIRRQQAHQGAHLAHGVHVIAAQETDGSITIGDSHAYGADADGKRSEAVDQLIMADLEGMISLPDPRIAERWLGSYAHLPGQDVLRAQPEPGVTALTMTNGQGMTHGFAVAEETIKALAG